MSQWVVNHLVDGVEVWMHAVLFKLGVYPNQSFRKHVRLGTLVWMCDIQEVHDYVSEVVQALKAPLMGNMLKQVVVIGFSRGHLDSQTVLEFPGDFKRQIFEAIGNEMHSELELGRFVDAQFIQIVDAVYASPSLSKCQEPEWRVIAETKRPSQPRDDILVDSISLMTDDGIVAFRDAQACNDIHPIKSLTINPNSTAWLSCLVEKFPATIS